MEKERKTQGPTDQLCHVINIEPEKAGVIR